MNFRAYILGDIEEKTAFLKTLSTNTVVRRKKLNSIIEDMKKTYGSHKDMVRNFINYKYKNVMPVKMEKNLNVTEYSFEESSLKVLFEKSQRILRGVKVDKFILNVDEIYFLLNVKVMKDNEIINNYLLFLGM